MKTKTIKQHIVPNALIKRWCFKLANREDNFFYLMDRKGNVYLKKRRKNSIIFAREFFFEDNGKDWSGNRIEKKLSRLESDYSQFADRMINKRYDFNSGRIEITPYEKCLLLTFANLQFFRVKLMELHNDKRDKLLKKIDLFLDFYQDFKKIPLEKIEEKCLEVRNNFKNGIERFKNSSPKKLKNFYLSFESIPSNKIFLDLQDFSHVLFIKRYEKLIWPLPVLGWFGIKIGNEQNFYESKIFPLSPNIILATYPHSDFMYINQNFISKDFMIRLNNEEYFLKNYLFEISIWYLSKMKLPIIIPKIFFDYHEINIFYKKILIIKMVQLNNEYKEIKAMRKKEIKQRRVYRTKIYGKRGK